MPSHDRRDPLSEERERARQTPDPDVTAEGEGDEAVHPSLGPPPRREESRPLFRSSQLQHDDDKPAEGRPLRG